VGNASGNMGVVEVHQSDGSTRGRENGRRGGVSTTASGGRWPAATQRCSCKSRSEVRRWASSRNKEREESVHGIGCHREQERRRRSGQKSGKGGSDRCSRSENGVAGVCCFVATLWNGENKLGALLGGNLEGWRWQIRCAEAEGDGEGSRGEGATRALG
jgi:hypothetical protein